MFSVSRVIKNEESTGEKDETAHHSGRSACPVRPVISGSTSSGLGPTGKDFGIWQAWSTGFGTVAPYAKRWSQRTPNTSKIGLIVLCTEGASRSDSVCGEPPAHICLVTEGASRSD